MFYLADSAYGNCNRLFVQLRIPPTRLLFPPGLVLPIQYGPVRNRAEKFLYNYYEAEMNEENHDENYDGNGYLVIFRHSARPRTLEEQVGEDAVFRLFESFATVVLCFWSALTLEHVEFLQISGAKEATNLLLVEDALGEPLLLYLPAVDFFFHSSLRDESKQE